MKEGSLRRFWPVGVPALLLAGAVVLGVLQFRWASAASVAEEGRMRALIGRGADQVAAESGEEVRVLLSLARVSPEEFAAGDWSRITSSLTLWFRNAPFLDLLQGLYIVRRLPDGNVLAWDRSAGSFTTGSLPAGLAAGMTAPLESAGRPQAWTTVRVDDRNTAYIAPVAGPDPSRKPTGAVIVVLDPQVVYEKVVPFYMERSLPDYPFRVVAAGTGEVIAQSSAPTAGRTPEIEEALASLRVADFGQRAGPGPGPDGAGSALSIDPLLQSWLQRVEGQASTPPSPPQIPSDATLQVFYPNRTLAGAVRAQQVLSLIAAFGLLGFLVASAIVLSRMYRRSVRLRASEQEFVASIGHELRTPIAVIQATSENLARGVVNEPGRLSRYAEVIHGQIRRLAGMVEGALLYSGLQSGRAQAPTVGEVDLAALLADVLRPLEPLAAERGSVLKLETEGLPRPVRTDPMAIRLIVENLTMNAIRHADPGPIRVSAARRAFDTLRLCVEDDGPGIPAREQTRVFEPFVRGDRSVRAQTPGSGLGLHLVRRVVSLLGGRAELESPYATLAGVTRKGCRFVVTLPCREMNA
jgi:signal transduction histidine kinase